MQLDSVGGPWEGSPRRSQGGPGGVREGPGGVPEGSRRGPGGVPAGSRGGARSTPEAQGGSEGDPEKNCEGPGPIWVRFGGQVGGLWGPLGAILVPKMAPRANKTSKIDFGGPLLTAKFGIKIN